MNCLDSNQVEQLRVISAQLRQAREAQGITLEQLAAKTYIPLRLLRALDGGQVELLPEPVFIQGFIRRYGDMVGLDGAALAQTFSLETAPPPPPPPPEIAESEPQPESFGLKNLPRPTLAVGGAVLAIAVLLLGGVALFNRPKAAAPTSQTQQAAPKASSKPALKPGQKPAPSQPPKNSTQPVAVPSQRPVPPSAAAPIEAAVNLTQESWVQVSADGKTVFEGTLPQGTQKTWTAKQQLTLLAGNAGGVMVAANRNAAKPMGKVGEVKEVTLTPNSLNQPSQL